MTGASKILTVSYGTFSCTLEGFDDPFSTMRSIAEYFRDLAADDRYFGAEPPTPDTAMLQRIAAQSQPGRIEARLNDDGVVLRQTDAAPQATPAVATAVAAPAPAPVVAPAAVAAAPDSVADKLSRIRAVVARSGGELGGFVEEEARFAPDAAANAASAPSPAPLSQDTPVAPAAPAAADSVNSGYQDEDEEVPSVLDTPADVSDPVADAIAADAIVEDDASDETDAEVAAEADADTSEVSAEDTAPVTATEPVSADSNDEDDLSARLAKLRDAEALKDSEASAQQTEETAQTHADGDTGFEEDQLSTDAAELDDQTDHVDGAITAEDASDSTVDESDAPSDLEDDEFETFAKAPVARGDVAVDRILEKTNTEMNEHEGSRRRSAIAHLKAAVAATRADSGGRAANADEDDDAMSQFRDDLAKAVRPQRPSSNPSGRRDERPTMANDSTPLMLVPSLRVDGSKGDADQQSVSVRPRRVANSDAVVEEDTLETEVSTAETFADFVAEQDARELPELMEAAAAYATHIEGRPHVTRPLVMRRVLEERDGLKREDALRTFGRLLRDGRIIRIKRGKFAVAEDTRFRVASNG